MKRIIERTKPCGSVVYLIQYKSWLFGWETITTYSASWHGEGGMEDLEFYSAEDAEKYLSPDKDKIIKYL